MARKVKRGNPSGGWRRPEAPEHPSAAERVLASLPSTQFLGLIRQGAPGGSPTKRRLTAGASRELSGVLPTPGGKMAVITIEEKVGGSCATNLGPISRTGGETEGRKAKTESPIPKKRAMAKVTATRRGYGGEKRSRKCD